MAFYKHSISFSNYFKINFYKDLHNCLIVSINCTLYCIAYCGYYIVMRHPYDILHTSTCFCLLSNQRPITRLPQSTVIYGNLPYSAMFCHILPTCFYRNICNICNVRDFCRILPSLLNSVKFCQDYDLKPILPRIHVNWAIKLIIYTPFSRFLVSFPYTTSWFHYIVHVYSLIISTLLYIIVTYTYSIILYCVNHLYYCIKCRINQKPL